MAGIVSSEGELVPEESKTESGEDVPFSSQEVEESNEQERISYTFSSIGRIVALIETLSFYSFPQGMVLFDDAVLSDGVERGIGGDVQFDLFSCSDIEMGHLGSRF